MEPTGTRLTSSKCDCPPYRQQPQTYAGPQAMILGSCEIWLREAQALGFQCFSYPGSDFKTNKIRQLPLPSDACLSEAMAISPL